MSSINLCQGCKTEYWHNDDGVKECPSCSSPYWSLVPSKPSEDVAPISKAAQTQTNKTAQSQTKSVPISHRSATQNLEVVESLLSNLAGTNKYKRAISDGEFASFSIIGTTDWQDYASLSIDALQLLTLAQINQNLEAIRKQLEGNPKD